jgi:site-specific DNA recombinase
MYMNKKTFDIRYVAVYVRKSRGEEDKDLDKHLSMLVEMCQKNNWKYVVYSEIGTSDSIEYRAEMSRLMRDLQDDLFDAVLVVDIDRLSRGDDVEQGQIKRLLSKTNTLVITPQKIFDFENDMDETIYDFHTFLARQEYRMIKKRLNRGKKLGSRKGDWTNGTPPFPYEYEKWRDKYNQKGLVVNDDKNLIYQYMKQLALNNVPNIEIAWELNKQGFPSPKNKLWSGMTVSRILQDETHLGKVISNKSMGDAHKNKRPNAKDYKVLPKSEWIIIENCHEAVKTIEEHNRILELNNNRKIIPARARPGIWTLSGLLRCGICKKLLGFNPKPNGNTQIKPCYNRNEFGENRCQNRGGQESLVVSAINIYIEKYRDKLISNPNENENNEHIGGILNEKLKQKQKYEKAIENAKMARDLGDYTREEWLKQTQHWKNLIDKVDEEIFLLNKKLNNLSNINRIEILEQTIKDLKLTTNPKVLNRLYKSIIKEVLWTRIGDQQPVIEVVFF